MTDLTAAIEAIIDESQRMGQDEFSKELASIADRMTTGHDDDDLYMEAIVDGIRWGAQAAVIVELDRGAMLRVCLPDGIRITHEWADRYEADPQIKAALDAITSARVTAQKVGDE